MGKKIRIFFVCFIILVLFSGALFFIGWTQFRVKADTAGVLVSKTGGVNENVIEGGEFSWHWEFLLPTNAQLRLFSTKPVLVEKRISGELPSGSVYAGLYKNSPDFSYNFDFLISAAVSKDSLPSLVKDGSLTDQDSLEKYINYAADDFIRSAVQKLISLPGQSSVFLPETIDYDSLFKDIAVSSKYPGIEIRSVSVRNVRIPDCELYQKARDVYLQSQVPSFTQNDGAGTENKSGSSAGGGQSLKKNAASDEEKALDLLNQLKSIFSEQ